MGCGGCTLCCKLCEVPELGKAAGVACNHAGDSGCRIYEARPKSCRDMQCAWLQSGAHESIRPDRCGVFWERIGDTMYGYRDTDRKDHPHLSAQIRMFKAQGAKVKVDGCRVV